MDKELILGSYVLRKHPTTSADLIALPDPRFCNFMLAIKRVPHGSGAAEVVDLLRQDDEHSKERGSSMGSSMSLMISLVQNSTLFPCHSKLHQ
jgi:hypothetical protein